MWDRNPKLYFRKFPEDHYRLVEFPVVPYDSARHSGNFKLWLEEINTLGDFLIIVSDKIYSYSVKEVPKPSVKVERK